MGSRLTLDGEMLQDRIKMLLSFYTPSKIYYYGNYTRVSLVNNEIQFTQVQIIGESINTGLLEVSLKGIQGGENVVTTIPTEELSKVVNQIPLETLTITIEPNRVVISSKDKEITLPVTDSEIPKTLVDNHNLVKHEPMTLIEIDKLNDAIKVVDQATKGIIVSYDNHAIYIEDTSVIVNKGVRITRHYLDSPLGLAGALYLPIYMVKVLKHLKGRIVELRRSTTPMGEEIVLLQGDGFSIHFLEWYSKKDFDIDAINFITSIEPIEEDDSEYLESLSELSSASKVLELNLQDGTISTQDKTIVLEVTPKQSPIVYISTEVMPKKAELKKYDTLKINESMVKFQGDNLITVVATMDVS